MTSNTAIISEIFQSIQGEGVYVGERQIFVRFSGCNIACAYCDTTEDKIQSAPPKAEGGTKCTVKKFDGTEYIDNPVTAEKVLNVIDAFISKQSLFHSIAITGGEPLLQVDFLLDILKQIQIKKYIETNGIFYDRMAEIIELVDIIAMDFKLPSATKTEAYFEDHKRFLKIAKAKEVFVKAVFSKETTTKEIETVSQIIADEDPSIPLVLQPVTPSRHFKSKPTGQQCLSFQAIAKRKLQKVLVIPQVHKILEVD